MDKQGFIRIAIEATLAAVGTRVIGNQFFSRLYAHVIYEQAGDPPDVLHLKGWTPTNEGGRPLEIPEGQILGVLVDGMGGTSSVLGPSKRTNESPFDSWLRDARLALKRKGAFAALN